MPQIVHTISCEGRLRPGEERTQHPGTRLSFERAGEFDLGSALRVEDTRRDYGERRIIATGYLDDRLHVLCFMEIDGGIRVISFRKANRREARKYAEAKASH